MKNDTCAQFLCKDCEDFALCHYYDGRNEDSYICKYFHLRDRSKGRWIDGMNEKCSACGTEFFADILNLTTDIGYPNFCPMCGADMRGESIDPNDFTHMFDGVTEWPKDAFKGWTTEELLEQIRGRKEGKVNERTN